MAAPRRTSIGSHRNPESEEAILSAAEDILREGGLGAFSIEAVARRAKAGKPTIYRWWPSRTALLLDVYHRLKDDIPLPDTGDIRQDCLIFVSGLFMFWRRGSAAVFRSVIAEAQNDEAASAALGDYMAQRRAQCGDIIRKAQARGEVRKDVDPELIQELLSSFAWSRLLTDRLDGSDGDIEVVVDTILGGIRA